MPQGAALSPMPRRCGSTGLADRPGLGVEFTLPAGPARPRSSHPGIVLHSGEVAADEWTTRSDLFVTTPAHTLRDLTYSGRFDLAELGRVGGRPTVATPEIIRAARGMLPNPNASVTSIAVCGW